MSAFVLLHPDIVRLQAVWPTLTPLQQSVELTLTEMHHATPIMNRLMGKTCFTKAHYERVGALYAPH